MPRPNWREESVSVAGIDVHFYRGGEGPREYFAPPGYRGHLVFYGQEARTSHAATMRSIALFGKEVMPAMHEW